MENLPPSGPNAEQIAYLRECLEKRPGLPHHLLKAGVVRTLATTQQQIASLASRA